TARCEAHNAHGRSDLEIQTDKNYWVLEFKYCRKGDSPEALLQEAVRQIKARQYGSQLPQSNLIRAALVFSQKERKFTHWAEVWD
ncbi:PD-(D/E)XK nuclease domain-containing protein, partial [Parasutterella excrementihominis]